MLLTRHFRVVELENKKVNIGGVIIKSKNNPRSAASKLLTSIAHEKGLMKNKKIKLGKVKFSIQEYTQGSKKKIYGPYIGYFHKYTKNELKTSYSAEGKIKFTMKPIVKLLKKNIKGGNIIVQKGKGDLLSNKNNYSSKTSNFESLESLKKSIGDHISSQFDRYIEYESHQPLMNILLHILNKDVNDDKFKYKLFILHKIFNFKFDKKKIKQAKKKLVEEEYPIIKTKTNTNTIIPLISVLNKKKDEPNSTFYDNLGIGIVIYVKNENNHKKYNFSSYYKKTSGNFKVLFFRNNTNLFEILKFFHSSKITEKSENQASVIKSHTEKCLSTGSIRLRANNGTWCISENKNYIRKFEAKKYIHQDTDLELGDFVIEKEGSIYNWTKFNQYFKEVSNHLDKIYSTINNST